MKFLLDMPVSRALADVLHGRGHIADHAADLDLERATDQELIDRAQRDESVVVTADLDFPRLLVLSLASRPGLILFRGGNYTDAQMAALLTRVLDVVSPEVLARSICVVDRARIRLRELRSRKAGQGDPGREPTSASA